VKINKFSREELIARANAFAIDTLRYKGAPSGKPNGHLPALDARTVGKMGLKPFRPLLHIADADAGGAPGGRGGQGQRGGGGGGGGSRGGGGGAPRRGGPPRA
jgi:uncharacterized membrane protein YgcG